MKKIAVFLFTCILSTQSFAERTPFLEIVIFEMGKQYTKEAGQTKAFEILASRAGQELANNLSSKLAQGTAVIGLANSFNDYQEGNSDSSKYHALAQGLAHTVNLINPAVGGFVQLGVMAQGLASALISQKYSIKISQLDAEIAEIKTKTSEIIQAEAFAEKKVVEGLAGRSAAITELMKANTQVLSNHCSLAERNLKFLQICINDIFLQIKLSRAQEQTLVRILTFKGRFFIAANVPSEHLAEAKELLSKTMIELNTQTRVINNLLASFVESKVTESKQEALKRAYFYECDRLIHASMKDIFEAKKEILTNQDPNGFAEISLPDFQFDLKNLTEGRCKPYLPQVDPEIRELISTAVE